jgi:hypothetical protein
MGGDPMQEAVRVRRTTVVNNDMGGTSGSSKSQNGPGDGAADGDDLSGRKRPSTFASHTATVGAYVVG